MPTVPTRLGDVAYRSEGQGPPIVLLHATLHNSHDYDAITPQLAKAYHVIAVDWPWHGASRGLVKTDTLSAPALADALEDFVTALDLPPAFFIGNSVGGFAAARLAITQPRRVRGLVLVNNGGFLSLPFYMAFLSRYVFGTPFITRLVMPPFVAQYMQSQTAQDERIAKETAVRAKSMEGSQVAAAIWRSFPDEGHDLRKRAAEIRAPTLIVWGAKDRAFPKDAGKEVQKYIDGSRLELFETGHVVFSSKPDEFLGVVEPFLKSIPIPEAT